MESPHLEFSIQQITGEQTHALRQQILRPHQNINEMEYPNDSWPESFHLGAISQNKIVGIVSLYPENQEALKNKESWRLRGMATDLELQG